MCAAVDFRAPLTDTEFPDQSKIEIQKIKNAFHPTFFGAKETNHSKLNDNLGTTSAPATNVLLQLVDDCLRE
jgi:hypothetical protein